MQHIDDYARALADLALPRLKKMSERCEGGVADIQLTIFQDGRIDWCAYTARYGHGNLMAKTAESAFASAEERIQDSPELLVARASKLEAEAAALRAAAGRNQ